MQSKKDQENVLFELKNSNMEVLKEVKVEGKNLLLGAAMRGNFNKFYKSIVVLANPRTIVNDRYAKKVIKDQVLRSDQIINVLKKMNSESKEIRSSKKEMLAIAERLLCRNKDERKDYFTKYQELRDQIESEPIIDSASQGEVKKTVSAENGDKEKMVCPQCGSELVLRTAKKGTNAGQQFYGCTNFPNCRFILNLSKNV